MTKRAMPKSANRGFKSGSRMMVWKDQSVLDEVKERQEKAMKAALEEPVSEELVALVRKAMRGAR